MDVKRKLFGTNKLFTFGGRHSTGLDPVDFAGLMQNMGAGEIIITSIEKDGTMQGYDLDLVKQIAESVTIPVIASGGAGKYDDFKKAVRQSYASAVAAGSMFVFHGPRKAVLINYPEKAVLENIFQ
jgi:cyclase